MRIGIIGAGSVGQAVGGLLARAGHEVQISWSSTAARLRAATENVGFGATSATPADATLGAEVVVFAPRFEHIDAAVKAAGSFEGKIVIDTSNPYNPQRDGFVDLGEQTVAQFVSARLPGARYVRGFTTIPTDTRLPELAGRSGSDRVVVPLSGDDSAAKAIAAGLVRDAGFAPVDLGTRADSGPQDPGGAFYGNEIRLADVPSLPRL